jgi:hypothetical protein
MCKHPKHKHKKGYVQRYKAKYQNEGLLRAIPQCPLIGYRSQNNDEMRHVNMAIKSSALMLFAAEQGIKTKYQKQHATYRRQESQNKTQSTRAQAGNHM